MVQTTSRREVAIFGAGGHAKVVIDTCLKAGFTPVVCLGESPLPILLGVAVEPEARATEWLARGVVDALVAIGNNRVRERVGQAALAQGFRLVTVIHPFAYVAPSTTLGRGTIVMAGAVVQPDASVGDLGIVNTGASIDHDCRLGRSVHIAPHSTLCGNVTAGDRVWIGAGSTVVEGTAIADDVFIAAGATVTRSIGQAGSRVGGVPARSIDR